MPRKYPGVGYAYYHYYHTYAVEERRRRSPRDMPGTTHDKANPVFGALQASEFDESAIDCLDVVVA